MKKYVLFILVGVILVLSALVLYFYKSANSKDVTSSSQNDNTSSSDKESSSVTSQSHTYGDEYLINTLYSYIPYNNGGEYENYNKNAYQNKLVTVSNLDTEVLMVNAMYNAVDSYGDGGFIVLSDSLSKTMIEMYGRSFTLLNKFNYAEISPCQSKTVNVGDTLDSTFNYYLCTTDGSGLAYTYSLRNLDGYEIDTNQIVIYDKEIFVRINYDDLDSQVEFYTDSTAKTNIANSNLKYSTNDNGEINSDKFIKDNASKMISYKHVFTKNADNKFYWYSTEPVE